MKKRYFVLIIVLITSWACTVTKKVKTGDEAYQLKQYSVAVGMLEKEYEQTKGQEVKFRKAFYLGKSYGILNQPDEAIRWFQKAVKHKPAPEIKEQLAFAYKRNEQYEDAHKEFIQFYNETGQNKWRQEAELCKQAIQRKSDLDDYNISTFSVNSKYGEYSPTYLDDEHIVFTSDREESQGSDTYKWTGNAFSDLYVTNINGRQVRSFDAIINTGANEGTACFSKDGNQIFFTRCESIDLRDQYCRIYFSHRPNGFWMEAEPLMFFSEKTNFAHPCLIENDSVLVFSAAPESSDGTYDLYYSERVDGGWTEPELMPSSINSLGNEKFPTSYKDTLFFSSDALPGYGGYDIFYTVLSTQGAWSKPVNMGIPINSGADDFGLAIDPTYKRNKQVELQGYFSSARNVGTGDDLFFFTKYVKEEKEDENPVAEDTAKEFKTYLSIRVVEIQYEDNDPNKKIIGKKAISNAKLDISYLKESQQAKTDKSGRYTLELQPDLQVLLTAEKKDYITNKLMASTALVGTPAGDTTINVELPLDKILYDKEIVLQSIYYDYERWEIRKDAKPSLDTLKNLLELNPSLKIQLISHTDCRGEVAYNQTLSQKRAESAVQYLTSSGIARERMSPLGMGEMHPAVICQCDNCSEAEHQANRRTTFKILRN